MALFTMFQKISQKFTLLWTADMKEIKEVMTDKNTIQRSHV
jgi:hypothetical protein